MSNLLKAMVLFCLVGCSSSHENAQAEENLYLLIEYTGSRYDLNTEVNHGNWREIKEIKESAPNTNNLIQINMSYMVICDDTKSECKHAAVASSVSYKIDSNLLISGTFNTEAGKRITVRDDLGFHTRSVPDGVEVALETKKSIPFSIQAQKGQVKTITGPSGDKIKLTITDKI